VREPDNLPGNTIIDRVRFGGRARDFAHFGYHLKASAMNRLDDRLFPARISDGFPGCVDAGADRRVRNIQATPDAFNQFVLRDQPPPLPSQGQQYFKHLRLDVDGLVLPKQDMPFGIDRTIGEPIGHGSFNSFPRPSHKDFPRGREIPRK
jgi:hypothetical protein